MLVLSRKTEQTIHIGDDIKVIIFKVQGNCVKVGIEAPPSMKILRGELESSELWDAKTESGSMDSKRLLVSCK